MDKHIREKGHLNNKDIAKVKDRTKIQGLAWQVKEQGRT